MHDEVDKNDFPDKFRDVVEAVGTEVALLLCKEFGGSRIYIPIYRSANRNARDIMIRTDYHDKKMTYSALSRKYELSESQIRTILRRRVLTIEDFIKED